MVSANCSALVWRDIDVADLNVLEIVQTAKADAVGVVVQIDSKFDLSALDLIRDLCVSEVVVRDPERKASGVRVDVGHCNACVSVARAPTNRSRSKRCAAAVSARLRVSSVPVVHLDTSVLSIIAST